MPFQVPFEAVSVWPSAGVPAIVGSAVFAGALGPTSTPGELVSTSAAPAEFVAVTWTRSRLPTSAETGL